MAATCLAAANILSPIFYGTGGSPLTLVLGRFVGFSLLAFIWFRVNGRSLVFPAGRRLSAYGIGFFYAIGSGSLLAGFAYLPVSLVILIFYTYPLLIAVFQAALDRRPPSLIEVICLLLAFLGLYLALDVTFADLHPTGLMFSVAAAITMAVAFVWSGRSMADVDADLLTFHMAICGIGVGVGLSLTVGSLDFPHTDPVAWWTVTGFVAAFTAAFFGMFYGIRAIGSVRTGMLMNLEPVGTIILSIAVLGEVMGPQQLAGAALVIAAVVIAQWRQPTAGPSDSS